MDQIQKFEGAYQIQKGHEFGATVPARFFFLGALGDSGEYLSFLDCRGFTRITRICFPGFSGHSFERCTPDKAEWRRIGNVAQWELRLARATGGEQEDLTFANEVGIEKIGICVSDAGPGRGAMQLSLRDGPECVAVTDRVFCGSRRRSDGRR